MDQRDDVFSKILRGEIPAYKIYEDEFVLAFLDIEPVTEGHTLVIPKKYAKWVWEIEDIKEVMMACQKIANHFKKVTSQEIVYSLIHGEGVPYAHIHLFPKHDERFNEAIRALSGKLDFDKAEDIRNKYKLD
jgi:histidine triad (HIT) family protein